MQYWIVALCAVGILASNGMLMLALRLAAIRARRYPGDLVRGCALNPVRIGGLSLYVALIGYWLWLLASSMPLARAISVLALAFIFTAIACVKVLRLKIGAWFWFGIALVAVGMVVMAM